MNVLKWLFIGVFGAMFAAFALEFIKAWILEIVYHHKKRKAIKNKSDDRWIYKN